MREHIWYKCDCYEVGCQFCDGGLGACTVCGGFEGTLTTECPGVRITPEQEDRIYKIGNLDFRDGEWVNKPNYPRTPKKTSVVHCKKEPYDVLIDRTTKWGNPFIVGKDGNHEECVEKHMLWFVNQPELIADLHELKGKILGCWCKPEKWCHGDNFIYLLDGNANHNVLNLEAYPW